VSARPDAALNQRAGAAGAQVCRFLHSTNGRRRPRRGTPGGPTEPREVAGSGPAAALKDGLVEACVVGRHELRPGQHAMDLRPELSKCRLA
jgi:hypothetical protein